MLTREQKNNIISDLSEKTKNAQSVLLADFTGVNVAEMNALRRELRKSGVEIKSVKKTLAQRIISNAGIKSFNIFRFPASVAFIFSPEEGIAVSRGIHDFSKKTASKSFSILGGFFSGDFASAETIIKLAKLPGREVLLGQLLYVLNSAPRSLVGVLQGNIRKLVFALDQISRSKA